MNTKALYNLTYGVYLMSARDGGKDNACIINTAVQVANNPAPDGCCTKSYNTCSRNEGKSASPLSRADIEAITKAVIARLSQ